MSWDLFSKFFDSSFASRWTGQCTGWTKQLVTAHVVADLSIWLAYMTIPVALVVIVSKRKDLPFSLFFFLFAVFIIGCGLTHLVGAITSFWPYYYVDFWVKALTALASVGTSILLWRMLPQIIKLPNPFTALVTLDNAYKELAESKMINKELENFALVVAHDLQDPMKQNRALLRLLRGAITEEERQEYRNDMDANNLRMSNFVKNLLAYARSGNTELKCRPTDVNKLINGVLIDLGVAIKESKARINVGPMPREVVCDQTQVARVFQNLIKNAINWRSPARRLVIDVSSRQEGGFWNFTVTDNGQGIPGEVMPTIFTVYRGRKRDSSGVGFGLAICKRIVQNHNGTIEVRSKVGSGASFTFSISEKIDAEGRN